MNDPLGALETFFVAPSPQTVAMERLLAQLDTGLIADSWPAGSLEQAWTGAPNVVGPLLVLLHAGDRVALLRALSACVRGALCFAPADHAAPSAALDVIDAFLAGRAAVADVTLASAANAELTWCAPAPLAYAACAVDHVCRAVIEPAPSADAIECVVVASHEYVRAALPTATVDDRLVQQRGLRSAMLDAVRAAVPCPSLDALRTSSDLGLAREYEHILIQL